MKIINNKKFVEVIAIISAYHEIITDAQLAVMLLKTGEYQIITKEDNQLAIKFGKQKVMPVILYYCIEDKTILNVIDAEYKYTVNGVKKTALELVKTARKEGKNQNIMTTSEAATILRSLGKYVNNI